MFNKLKNLFSSKKETNIAEEGGKKSYMSPNFVDDKIEKTQSREFDYQELNSVKDRQIAVIVNYASLANAISRAIEQFGVSIVNDKRIINIINDFHGYKDCPHAKSILLTYFKEDRLSQIVALKDFEKNRIEERIIRQALKDSTLYGYSQEFVKDIYIAILYALGRKDIFCRQDVSESNQINQFEKAANEKQHESAYSIRNKKENSLNIPKTASDITVKSRNNDNKNKIYTENKVGNGANYRNKYNSANSQLIHIAEVIAKIISNTLHIPLHEIGLDSNFRELGMDSLDIVEVIMAIEKNYGISIPDENAEKIGSLRDAATYVKWHLDNY